MPLSEVQKIQVRRHLGFPVAGLLQISPAGGTIAQANVGYRYFQAYGTLEYRMNNLSPGEEAALLGTAVGAIALVGPQPNQGDSISVVLSGGNIPALTPQTVTATAGAPQPNIDGRLQLCYQLASLVPQNTVLQTAGVYAATPYGTGPYAANAVPLPEISFVSPVTFSLSATASAGAVLWPSVTATGSLVDPQTTVDGITQINGYLPILGALEGAWGGASQNLDTIKADVWQGRSNEAGARRSMYEIWREMMSDFLGVPINPDKRYRADRRGAMRFA